MRSKTSFFNPTLFWKNITRFWPIWASYLVIWFFLIPLSLMLTDNDYSTYSGLVSSSQGHFALVTVLRLTQTTVPALCLVYGLISAMALFSYLFQGRAVNLMHALPIRREGLFLTNYLSGLAFTLAPALAVALITLVAEITRKSAGPAGVLPHPQFPGPGALLPVRPGAGHLCVRYVLHQRGGL